MSLGTRLKQLVMVTGLLTLLAVTALVGIVVYLWWDTRGESADYEVDTDFETDIDTQPDLETDPSDEELDTSESETDDTSESGSDAVAS